MALRNRPREAIAQPQGIPDIAWGNPITAGLSYVYCGQVGGIFGGTVQTALNSRVGVRGWGGYVSVPSGQNNAFVTTGPTNVTGTAYSLFAYGTLPSASSVRMAIDDDLDTSSPRVFQFRINAGKTEIITFDTSGNPYFATAATALSTTQLAAGVAMGASVNGNSVASFQNGVKASTTASNTQRQPTGNFYIGQHKGAGGGGWDGELFLAVCWSRTLTDAEQVSLAANPWQIFTDDLYIPIISSGNATANGAVLDAVASLIGGTATGQINSTASGAVLDAVASFIAGTASGSNSATASGAMLDAVASLIAGTATGQVNATASGSLLEAVGSLIAGAASGGTNATANGATLDAIATLIPGSATGQINATASGAIFSAIATLLGGSASGNVASGTTNFGKLHISISISI